MDNQRNILSMDFANSPDLKALVSAWTIGESYDLKLKIQLNEMTPDGAKFSVKEVTSEEREQEDKDAIKPEADTPVMIVMAGGAGGAKEPYVAP